MVNIILADDHDIVRTGLKRLLDDEPDISVIGEARNGHEAIALVEKSVPDIAILDINMPDLNGIEASERLQRDYPQVKVIIVSMHSDEIMLQRLLNAGASAYLTKGSGLDEITHAINKVMSGDNYICQEVAQKMALVNSGINTQSPFQGLSDRELQVLGLIIQGQKVNDISEKLHLSPKTVSTYRTRLFRKLDVKNDVELTKLAMQYGYLDELPLP